jgi:hypothetical protein
MKQKRILHFVFLGTLVSILSVFVACSNDDDNFSKEPPGSLIVDTAWYGPSQTEFVITTAEALAGLAKLVNDGNDFTGKTIKLGANIMLNDTANWQNWASNPPANEWISIGAYFYDEKIKDYDNKIFKGIFDGNDFIVSGIYINGNLGYYGLFGYVSSGGIIKNLGVYASYIKGDYIVGGLVGNNMGATINNCSFTGTIMAESYAGGLVGQNVAGKINNSFSTGSITGTGSANGSVGGLVGRNADEGDSTISNSYSTSTVIGKSKVGGLVGENDMSIISDSYSTGMVTGEGYVGGLVGWNTYSTINNSYSTSMVTGENSVGGLVGEGGTIYNS